MSTLNFDPVNLFPERVVAGEAGNLEMSLGAYKNLNSHKHHLIEWNFGFGQFDTLSTTSNQKPLPKVLVGFYLFIYFNFFKFCLIFKLSLSLFT